MHVLIVEDDLALGQSLERGLKLDGHHVSVVSDGQAALRFARRLKPELMILDLDPPQRNRLEILTGMGEHLPATSILAVTGRSGMDERVRCLEGGADDVVLKPFSFRELRARLKALGRRRMRLEDAVLRFGDVEMDRVKHSVVRGGVKVDLTQTEYALLEALLRRRGERVCTRAELLHEVWRAVESVGTNVVEVYINYLRRKLGQRTLDGSQSGCAIRTVRGQGYILERGTLAEKSPARDYAVMLQQAAG